MESVEHQQRALQAFRGNSGQGLVVEQVDQWLNVIAAQHRAQQFSCFFRRNQRAFFGAESNGGQVRCFNLGGVVNACWYTIGNQLDQVLFFTGRRILQQFDEVCRLLSRQRKRGDAKRSAFSNVLAVVIQHVTCPLIEDEGKT